MDVLKKCVIGLAFAIMFMGIMGSCVSTVQYTETAAMMAVRNTCSAAPQSERYACIERHALAELNPDICRLAGIDTDDMCLQALYESAQDPNICELLYLQSAQTNCREYYGNTGFVSPLPAPAATDNTNLLPDDLVESLSARQANVYASYPSPDGQWRMDIVIYACAQVAGQEEETAYEQLRLHQLSSGLETLIYDQRINCGGLGAFGLEGQRWSPDSHYFYFTDAREGVPDGLGDWQPPIFRYDVVQNEVERRDQDLLLLLESLPGAIAYVHEGDIFIKDLATGDDERITNDGFNMEPSWSPSGKWLAFRKLDSQLWLYSMAEKQAAVLDEGAPINQFSWSPVDDRIAYTVGSGMLHMRVLSAGDTESQILLPPSSTRHPGRFAWDPSGQYIAYEVYETQEDGDLIQLIQSIPASGGESRTLVVGPPIFEHSLSLAGWLPQGDGILFWHGPSLIDSRLPDTIDLLQISTEAGAEPTPYAEDVAWMLTGDLVPAPSGSPWWSQNIVAVTVGDGPLWTNKHIEIADRRLTPADQVAMQPNWSPGGQFLAYSGMPDPRDDQYDASEHLSKLRLWIANTWAEASPRQLTDDPGYRDEAPQWSADGAIILFARVDAEEQASLWFISAAGGAPKLIVEKISINNPAGHPLQWIEWDKSFDWHRTEDAS